MPLTLGMNFRYFDIYLKCGLKLRTDSKLLLAISSLLCFLTACILTTLFIDPTQLQMCAFVTKKKTFIFHLDGCDEELAVFKYL